MKREYQSRESDYVQNPDYGFIRDCVMDLKQTGHCYCYKKWQVEEIQKMFKIRYKSDTSYRFTNWYYTIRICN